MLTQIRIGVTFASWFSLVVLATSLSALGQATTLIQAKPREIGNLKPPAVGFEKGPVIPGLRDGAIPQGIAYAAERKKLIVSHYFDDGTKPSCLSVLNKRGGKLVATITLKDNLGKPHMGHAGGIAVMDDSLFVASDGQVMRYKLDAIISDNPPEAVLPVASSRSETKASFCSATEKFLFVGEFAYQQKFITDRSHHLNVRDGETQRAWVCGYSINDPFGDPELVLSIPDRVQGMCVTDKYIFLSVSYGRMNRSEILIYRNPIDEKAHMLATVRSGKKVPLWILDCENPLSKIDFPPMSEGIVMIDGRLAVISESGAKKYAFGGKGPLDYILFLDTSEIP